jgi:hypothetical protein
MLPFLYLPDAITLILLLIVFGMLRMAAIDHIRQELLNIRREMLSYWLNNALDTNDCGYVALRNLINSSIKLAPRLTPGRLVFIYRLQRNRTLSLPDPSHEVSLLVKGTANANGREKLKRLQMEMNLGLGVFFLMGSLSGWLFLFIIVPRMLKRTISHHKDDRVDFFFDMLERMLLSLGRQAQQIGRAGA